MVISKRWKIVWKLVLSLKLVPHIYELVMDHNQNLRELSINVISQFTIWVNCELSEWQFSLMFVILSEKLAKFNIISSENF